MFLHKRLTRPATALLVVVVGVALLALPATSLGIGSSGLAFEYQASRGETSSPSGVMFVENAGQWPEAARFQVWGSPLGAGTTWLAEDAIWVVVVGKSEVTKSLSGAEWRGSEGKKLDRELNLTSDLTALKLTFPGSNPDVRIEPFDPLTTTVSYFNGNDPDQWRPAVPVYGGVRYADLYPGVDLVLDARDAFWRLEATPGAAVEQVRVQVEGADILALEGTALKLDAARGPLFITLPLAPFAFTASGFSRQDESRVMTVEPGQRRPMSDRPNDDPSDLLYSTFLGGSTNDYSSDIAIDGVGSAYVTGMTGSNDFPTTPGAFDPSHNGGAFDGFVVKLNAAGNALAYATFLGGNDNDHGRAIAVDSMGRAYVSGNTLSVNFPTTPGAFDTSYNGGYYDAFVVRLNSAGSSLDYATFLGGGNHDESEAISVDELGRAYVTGGTSSTDFPTTPGAFDTSLNTNGDAFVVKLNVTGSGLTYATFLGGRYPDSGYGIDVDETDSAYVTGSTYSDDFPTTPGAFDRSQNGRYDAFVVKLSSAGSGLAFATYLGGSGDDSGDAIALDEGGRAYVMGTTSSTNFPTTPGAFDQSFNGGEYDAFVAKLGPTGSNLVYATYLGGSGSEQDTSAGFGSSIAVDETGNVYGAGSTESSDFPTTFNAFDPSYNGDSDAYTFKLNSAGSALNYATFLGGNNVDLGAAMALDRSSRVFVTGQTFSSGFPTTPSAFDTSHNGQGDVFVAMLDMEPYAPNVLAPIEQPNAGALLSGAVTLRGFAIDLGSGSGTGIDTIHIYLDGPYGAGTIIGAATYGLDRPDVAAQYGARFGPSGWELTWNTTGLSSGTHQLYVYAHRTTDNTWSQMPPHLVVVRGDHAFWLPLGFHNQ